MYIAMIWFFCIILASLSDVYAIYYLSIYGFNFILQNTMFHIKALHCIAMILQYIFCVIVWYLRNLFIYSFMVLTSQYKTQCSTFKLSIFSERLLAKHKSRISGTQKLQGLADSGPRRHTAEIFAVACRESSNQYYGTRGQDSESGRSSIHFNMRFCSFL